ncbi:MAG: CAP domain-containing protein [Trueperaceae bacterium]|nr:CAP domain-containing protein [Trueperaceae bacterium]
MSLPSRRLPIVAVLLTALLISCDLLGGGASQAVRIESFTAAPDVVASGDSVTLSWSVTSTASFTLSLLPMGTDVTGQTSATVSPTRTTTYELVAAHDSGEVRAEVTVSVLQPGTGALRVEIPGLPAGSDAQVAVSDHAGVTRWVRSADTLVDLPVGTYTVAAAGVDASGAVYLPDPFLQLVTLADRAVTEGVVGYAAQTTPLFAVPPDVGSCDEGELAAQAKEWALAEVNFLRVLAGLPPVVYDDAAQTEVQQASLMFAANAQTSHSPPPEWHCFSAAGADGAASSNNGITARNAPIDAVPEDFIALWADDRDVPGLGHRRWLLDPFLARTAFGLVEGTPRTGGFSHAVGAALAVTGGGDADIGGLELPFVAYPRGDFPTELFSNDGFLSFSVLADPSARFGNDDEVDYSAATVRVRDAAGTNLSVSGVSTDHSAQGLPNQLQWKVTGLQDGEEYTVEIDGVVVNGASETFRYPVRLR